MVDQSPSTLSTPNQIIPLADALEAIEIYRPPALAVGTKVRAKVAIRNDGTYPGERMGEILLERGEIGYVNRVGTFLQRYYIYSVDFFRLGRVVGMRLQELEVVADPFGAVVQPEEARS